MSLDKFFIVDSTLREGEQNNKLFLSQENKIKIAFALDEFGMDYIELSSPSISDNTHKLCCQLSQSKLSAKILTHIRCNLEDAKIALNTGVDGINLFFGTSSFLKQFSHGKSINEILDISLDVIDFIKKQRPEIELRFSCEDAFRSTEDDIFKLILAMEIQNKIDRFGLADTVGAALPEEIENVVTELRVYTDKDIEFHGHNDTGCAIINSYIALRAGATHIDTSVLGIGERNGITPLAGLIAILFNKKKDLLNKKYNLKHLKSLYKLFSELSNINTPFDHYIVGESAFCHKGGIHTNAVLNNPSSYECIDPEYFNIERKILVTHEMVGWHAIKFRAEEIGLFLDNDKIKALTDIIKKLASSRKITLNEVDDILKMGV